MISWIWCVVLLVACYVLHRWRLRVVFMRGTKLLAEQHAELRIELDAARARADKNFDKIAELERERDGWLESYTKQSIGHGNAQNLMMQTINDMGAIMSAKGIKYRIPRVLKEVRDEFQQQHELPARELLSKQKASSPQSA